MDDRVSFVPSVEGLYSYITNVLRKTSRTLPAGTVGESFDTQ